MFLRTTYIHNKYMYTIRAYYLQYCGSYAPHRQRRTLYDGRWTMDTGPSTPYYKLTGELKNKFIMNVKILCFQEANVLGIWYHVI